VRDFIEKAIHGDRDFLAAFTPERDPVECPNRSNPQELALLRGSMTQDILTDRAIARVPEGAVDEPTVRCYVTQKPYLTFTGDRT